MSQAVMPKGGIWEARFGGRACSVALSVVGTRPWAAAPSPGGSAVHDLTVFWPLFLEGDFFSLMLWWLPGRLTVTSWSPLCLVQMAVPTQARGLPPAPAGRTGLAGITVCFPHSRTDDLCPWPGISDSACVDSY